MCRKWTLKLMPVLKIHLEDVNLQRRQRKKKKERKFLSQKKKLKKTVKMKGKILLLTASVRPQISSKSKLKSNKKWKPSSGCPSISDDSKCPGTKKRTYFNDEEELSD